MGIRREARTAKTDERERGGGVTLGFSTYLFLSSRKRGRDMCLGFPINNRVIF